MTTPNKPNPRKMMRIFAARAFVKKQCFLIKIQLKNQLQIPVKDARFQNEMSVFQ